MKFPCSSIWALFVATAAVVDAKLSPEQVAKLPPPSTARVDFVRDVKPILDAACVKCHGKGKEKGGFSIETSASFLKGGDSGAPIVVGKSAESLLIELVAGFDPETIMPQKGSKLKPEQIATLRAWIDQGAKWPVEITFQKAPINNLHPRRVELPVVKGVENPMDRLLASYFSAHRVSAKATVEDRIFARRVYLDVVGVLPTPKELDEFLADKRADKRSRLVEKLLGDNRRYAEHWLTFWNDHLRNDYKGAGYIDNGRKPITTWLFSALLTNKPYDQFVAELVNPTKESEGFINGISWRGAVNASQVPVMQAAQSIGQVFMGVNLKCASCHDSFINDYTLADSYGIAAIFATNKLEIAECDKPTGKFAKVKFLYTELGEIDITLNKTGRTQRLAEILTARQDGRLTRTIVNRLWAKFMGYGLVEPVDEMDAAAWNADVLDWLSEDLADNGYDLKRTMKWILTSRAYQLPSVNLGEQQDRQFVFTGPAIRRLSAEQFRDALGELTGVYYEKPAFTAEAVGVGAVKFPKFAKWIWSEADAEKKALAEPIYLRKTFTLAALPKKAHAAVACDNSFTLFVNGKEIASGKDYGQPNFVNLLPHLVVGENTVAAVAINHTPENKVPPAGEAPKESEANPAGFIFAAQLRGAELMEIVSDQSWKVSKTSAAGWQSVKFNSSTWSSSAELGAANMAPWKVGSKLDTAMALAEEHSTVRASFVAADPLAVALGRPNREQITTTRSSAATTLQGLELTNGETLNKVVKRGAEKWLAGNKRKTDDLMTEVFAKSLGRKPTKNELKIAGELVGSPAKQEGLEDLLWSVAMLPEFQLIY
jgi:mono/diheme cytochrome c family protein